jgi:hypothetical protein
VDEVIAGRLTLPEAAAGFGAIDEVKGKYAPLVPAADMAGSEEDHLCRQVLALAGKRLLERPDREAVLARLQAELRQRPDGTRALPEFRRPENIPWFAP